MIDGPDRIDQGAPPRRGGRRTIAGVILAGGRALRMGGVDKGLLDVGGRPLVEWAIAALRPQVDTLRISANRNLEAYGRYGHPVSVDRLTGFQGPLAGIASALAATGTGWVATLPCDGPRPPPDLVARLAAALDRETGAQIAVAHDGIRLQTLYALIPVGLEPDLAAYLAGGERSVQGWYARHLIAVADFSDCPEAFANLNSPEDARRLGGLPGA